MTYRHLHELVWHPPLAFETPPGARDVPEVELQALWFAGAFGRDFKTTEGKPVRIVQFGEWNRGAGPDFFHCVVEIAGERFSGPLELDMTAADWERHGHAQDPAFREVVLHVVFRDAGRRSFARTCEHREVPQTLIPGQLLDDVLNRPPRQVAIAHPGRCLHPLRFLPGGALESLLSQAARYRAAGKAARWVRAEDAHGRDAALFHATAETLGYGSNPLPMRILSQRLPLARLKEHPQAAEALLFGVAGFLHPDLHQQAPPDTRGYLRGLWEIWWRHRADFEVAESRLIPWRLGGQRPAHHPHRRIAALACLLPQWTRYRSLALARPFAVKPLLDFLGALKHPFWSRRHTLTSAETNFGLALFGRSQGLEMVANHLAPLAMHENRMSYHDYHKLRNSAANQKVKRCGLRLFGTPQAAGIWMRRVAHHQALLQIYHDFCLEDLSDCNECPFPEQLSQWK